MSEGKPVYAGLMSHSHDAAARFLNSRKPTDDPTISNAVTAMMMVLAASATCVNAIEATMPVSLEEIDKDILAFEVLAYTTCSLQQAVRTRYRRERKDSVETARLQLISVARLIKEFFLDKIDPNLGVTWLDRWNEFRSIESLHERFGLLSYLLFTSKGHTTPLRRYPDSLPIILDLSLTLEGPIAEVACGQTLLDSVEALILICALMPPERADDDEQ